MTSLKPHEPEHTSSPPRPQTSPGAGAMPWAQTDLPPLSAPSPAASSAPVAGDGMWPREPWPRRWGRRAITMPALFVGTALYWALLPAVLAVCLPLDLARRSPLLRCRFQLTMASCLLWHVIGVLGIAYYGLLGLLLRPDEVRWRAWHRRLEGWWSHKTIGVATVFYGLRHQTEDAHVAAPGPSLILARHASIIDTLLPARLLSRGEDGLRMRIVIKRELLWDPAADVGGDRLPRAYVRRGSGDVEAELDALRHLTGGMDRGEAIVIFPEGTRFDEEKRAKLADPTRTKNPVVVERARRLAHLLPPRPAGSLAMLEARPDMDVVFMVHTGLEGANRLEDFVAGSLLGKTLKTRFFRVPRREIPMEPEAFSAWLQGWWERLDRWVATNREA